jgi:hypothetical protein
MLRKWRFLILIGAGLIAAGAVVYFSNGRISNDKTQGAIGNRDVYRDGKVASADVAKPGTAPVATEAILKSKEFKALAKNPAFQELLRTDAFNEMGRRSEFTDMLANEGFRRLVQDDHFRLLIQSETFKRAMDRGLSPDRLIAAVRSESDYARLADQKAFDALVAQHESAFKLLTRDKVFQDLLASGPFKAVLQDDKFALLAARQDFRAALLDGNASQKLADPDSKK